MKSIEIANFFIFSKNVTKSFYPLLLTHISDMSQHRNQRADVLLSLLENVSKIYSVWNNSKNEASNTKEVAFYSEFSKNNT